MRNVLVIAALVLGSLGLTAAPALANEPAPFVVASDRAERAYDPVVAVGPNGHAAIAWSRRISPYERHGLVRRRTPDGVWGPLEQFSTPMKDPWGQFDDAHGVDYPSVAVDAQGNTLVTWSTSIFYAPKTWPGAILAAYAPVGKPFRPQQTIAVDLSGSGAMYPRTSFTPAGEAVTVWQSVDNRVHSTVMKPGGEFLPDETIVEPIQGVSAQPAVVRTGRDGTVVVAWANRTEPPHGYTDRLQVAVRRPGKSFAPAQVLRSGPENSFAAVSGVAKDGSALISIYDFSWRTREIRQDIASLPAGSTTFSATKRVNTTSANMPLTTPAAAPLAIAFDDADTGYLLGLGEIGIWAQPATTSGELGKHARIAPPEAFGSDGLHNHHWDFDATYDAGGNLYIGWRGVETYGDDATEASFFAYTGTKPKGKPFDPVVQRQHSSTLIMPLKVAAGPSGDALAVWIHGWNGFGNLLLSNLTPGSATGQPEEPVTPTTPQEPVTPTTPIEPITPTAPAEPQTPTTPVKSDEPAAPQPQGSGTPTAPVTPTRDGTVTAPLVPLATTTPAGPRSAPPARAWCRIPDVRGLTLARAKRTLIAAGCSAGKVKRARGQRTGRVVRQSTPGAVREHRFKVVLVVAR